MNNLKDGSMPLHLCLTCMIPQERDADHFNRDKNKPDGLSPTCKACKKRTSDAHQLKNGEAIRARAKARRKKRRDEGLPRTIDPEKEAIRKETARIEAWEYYHKNIEKRQEANREAYKKNREERQARVRRWKEDNPDKVRANNAKRRGLIAQSNDHYTAADIGRLHATQLGLCHYCKREMKGRGRMMAVIEHMIPISRGGDSRAVNIVLACWECNEAKGSQTDDEFFARTDRPGINDT